MSYLLLTKETGVVRSGRPQERAKEERMGGRVGSGGRSEV